MIGHLKRLFATAFASQIGEIVSKLLAVVLLPLYTAYLSPAEFGRAEILLTGVILISIFVRLGIGEALVRFHFIDSDPLRRQRLARTAAGTLFVTTTVVAVAAAVAATPLSTLLLRSPHPEEFRAATLGLWAFSNLELAYALLRVEGRNRTYALTSVCNVGLTVILMVWLVIFEKQGVFGYLLGNYAASAVVLVCLWFVMRDIFGKLRIREIVDSSQLKAMLRFGLPTVPAEASVFALFVIDRLWLERFESAASVGFYSVAVKFSAAILLAVRAFQYAWPPVAYSIRSNSEAERVYARITTYYVLLSGLMVAALTLLGRWAVRLLRPEYFSAHKALPWIAIGWALYGLFLILVSMAGRAKVTVKNFPAALCGLAANIVLLALLVGPLGIVGAAIALCGGCLVMIAVMYLLTRKLFHVSFEWGRLARLLTVILVVTVIAEHVLPDDGVSGFVLRIGALVALLPIIWISGFFQAGELQYARGLFTKLRQQRAVGSGSSLSDSETTGPSVATNIEDNAKELVVDKSE